MHSKTNIEQKLDAITGNLEQMLRNANAIDETGRATNIAEFNRIINEKIDACSKVLSTTEEAGVTIDKYGANIAFARLSWLEEMRDKGAINPHAHIYGEEPEIKEDVVPRPSSFKSGIGKIFGKLKSKFSNTNSNTIER